MQHGITCQHCHRDPAYFLTSESKHTMSIQYRHQKNHSTEATAPRKLTKKQRREIITTQAKWPILDPLSPDTKAARMGCVPSRPSHSFYNEFFVESSRKQDAPQRPDRENLAPPPLVGPAPRGKSKERRPVTIAEVRFAEEVARGDLEIYEEEVEARKREMDQRTFVMHAAMRGDQVFF